MALLKRPREAVLQVGPLSQGIARSSLRQVSRKGGCRQRRQADPDEHAGGEDGAHGIYISRIGVGLLLEWTDGYLSSTKLCTALRRGYLDGDQCVLMNELGKKPIDQHRNQTVLQFAKSLTIVDIVAQVPHAYDHWSHFVPPR